MVFKFVAACCLYGSLQGAYGLASSPSFAQQLLNVALKSPLYEKVMVPQARRTMMQTAEANGVPWAASLAWLKGAAAWEAELEQATDPLTEVPAYYQQPFHAYLPNAQAALGAVAGGNLCWEAAWEQELAGKAVGQRNFPGAGPGGAAEAAFRGSFDACLAELGALTPGPGSLVVDLGCGTGTSTRRLAARCPLAQRVVGVDLSPHMVAVGTLLRARGVTAAEVATAAAAAPEPAATAAPATATATAWVEAVLSAVEEPRVVLLHRDAAHTRLDAGAATVVSLDLVCHELPPSAARDILHEAFRLLKPGGQLWLNEMDFDTAGFRNLRANPLLFSLIRATEPYLDEYADYQSGGGLVADLLTCGFGSVKLGAATGRHFACVATKPPNGGAGGTLGATVDDLRFDASTGRHRKEDTHLKTWESKKKKMP